jgi:hypothetical protein
MKQLVKAVKISSLANKKEDDEVSRYFGKPSPIVFTSIQSSSGIFSLYIFREKKT